MLQYEIGLTVFDEGYQWTISLNGKLHERNIETRSQWWQFKFITIHLSFPKAASNWLAIQKLTLLFLNI